MESLGVLLYLESWSTWSDALVMKLGPPPECVVHAWYYILAAAICNNYVIAYVIQHLTNTVNFKTEYLST